MFQIIFDRRKSINQYVMLIGVIIANTGYLSIACSTVLEEAILGLKMSYVGGCFLPMFFFLTICEICHIRVKSVFKVIMYLAQTALFSIICTIGRNGLYYKSTELCIRDGVGFLNREYGPLHALCPLSMYGYVIMSVTVVIYALHKKKSVNKKGLFRLLIFFIIATVSYGVEKLLDFELEIVPLVYTLLIIISMVYVYEANFFTVNENKNIIDKQLENLGFVTFDSKMRYMGCNETAEEIFPELRDFKVGYPIEKTGRDFKTAIIDVLENYSENVKSGDSSEKNTPSFERNRRKYDTIVYPLYKNRKKCAGYTVEIKDETEHYKALAISEDYGAKLAHDVEKKTGQIREIQQKTILGMAQMVESRDLSTGGHIKRTSEVVRIFSDRLLESDMDFDKEFLDLVVRSAPMHDLGKIGVDDAILRKQGKFTDEEYAKMKIHSEIGADIVKQVLTGVEEERFVEVAINVAHYHHEKVNGKGYPSGLSGDDIPVEARIMALADVFDALVSKRCYKESFSFDKAFDIIKTDSGTHFDAGLAEVFLKCRPELEEFYSSDV